MKGVMFDNFHTYLDFKLLLSTKTIGSPSAKTETIDVPGADGVLDLTEYFGQVNYKNRKLSFEFKTIEPISEFLNVFSAVQNALHGKKMKIILDDDPYFYYIGRVNVNEWKSDGRIGTIVVEADCEPYKYKLNKTIVVNPIENHAIIVYDNLRKPVVPTIKTSAGITIVFDNITKVLQTAGEYTIPEIVFREGENSITYEGTATVTVEYQEGGL